MTLKIIKVQQIIELFGLPDDTTKAQIIEKIKQLATERKALQQEQEKLGSALAQAEEALQKCQQEAQKDPSKRSIFALEDFKELLELPADFGTEEVLEALKNLKTNTADLRMQKEELEKQLAAKNNELVACTKDAEAKATEPATSITNDLIKPLAPSTSNPNQAMRKINYLVVHCTGAAQSQTIASIQNYWKTVNKWNDPGYHWIIKPDGEAVQLFPIDKPSNGVKGYNLESIHICYIGGVDAKGNPLDNRTAAQKASILTLLKKYRAEFPEAKIQGHRDFPGVTKSCPSFDAKKEYAAI